METDVEKKTDQMETVRGNGGWTCVHVCASVEIVGEKIPSTEGSLLRSNVLKNTCRIRYMVPGVLKSPRKRAFQNTAEIGHFQGATIHILGWL